MKSNKIGSLIAYLFPNKVIAIVLSLIAILELVLHSQCKTSFWFNSDLTLSARCALALFLFLSWISFSWMCWWGWKLIIGKSLRKGPIGLGLSFTFILISVICFFYISSWIFYWRTGTFIDLDAMRFGANNFKMIASYIWQAEKITLFTVATICISLLAIAHFQSVRSVRRGQEERTRSNASVFITLFITFDVAAFILLTSGNGEEYSPSGEWWKNDRVSANFELQSRLNPLLTLIVKPLFQQNQNSLMSGKLSEQELGPRREVIDQQKKTGNESLTEYSVIFIAVEALRNDVVALRHQGQEVMPHLNRLAMSGLQFTRCYAQSTHSNYADPCLFSSLYPLRSESHHYYSESDPWPKSMIYDVFKQYGYATAIYSSQNETWGHMNAFLESPNLDTFFDSRSFEGPTYTSTKDVGFKRYVEGADVAGKLDDAVTMRHALDWIENQQKKNKPFVLCMNLQTSHFPYEIPGGKPGPFQPSALDFDISFVSYPRDKIPVVRNAYYNSLHYVDQQIGRLVAFLKQKKLSEKTILIIAGDQGEAFYENGFPTHAGHPYEPVLRVALVMHNPELLPAGTNDYLTQAIDITPTICGLLKIEPHSCFQGCNVLSTECPPNDRRLAFVHCNSTLSGSDALISGTGWKFIYDSRKKLARLYNLSEDPGEVQDLTQTRPRIAKTMASLLMSWRRSQVLYYQTPTYYGWFYPPRTPVVSENQLLNLKSEASNELP
ncbi:Lipoteichoic acid synthase 2 [Gimesia chilikensis]|uniref:Lipoteichoic acid synthase 2 n=1 Tax=Gimesia chilikensis TaxID=2605989 RepID=A0A517WJH7_9PLAN|nr:sulfatase [Gimesia chilikensis]QDU05408.1 Lipoteichoic acid synthase 2 [Gimesia chilikensis]